MIHTMLPCVLHNVFFYSYIFKRLNNYHQNIKLGIEISPTKFIDTKLIRVRDIYKTMLHRNRTLQTTCYDSVIISLMTTSGQQTM